jgi:hypothetical protein
MIAPALIIASSFASPAMAQECWAPEVNAPRTAWTCTYTLAQCQEIVRLRRAGVCRQVALGRDLMGPIRGEQATPLRSLHRLRPQGATVQHPGLAAAHIGFMPFADR